MRIQEPRAEIIEGLEDMVKVCWIESRTTTVVLTFGTQFALQDFAKIAQGPPESIIFYRDGVSEGQFEQVRVNEISAVQSMLPTTRLIIRSSLTTTQVLLMPPFKVGKNNTTPPLQDPSSRFWL